MPCTLYLINLLPAQAHLHGGCCVFCFPRGFEFARVRYESNYCSTKIRKSEKRAKKNESEKRAKKNQSIHSRTNNRYTTRTKLHRYASPKINYVKYDSASFGAFSQSSYKFQKKLHTE